MICLIRWAVSGAARLIRETRKDFIAAKKRVEKERTRKYYG